MLTPGVFLGPYRILEKIGEGGMGEVYKASDPRLDRTVAIKLLTGSPEAQSALRERLQHEARALSRLNHPHICTLYDIGETSGAGVESTSYLVMELVEGETLAERLTAGPLPLPKCLTYGSQIADALDKAHRAGIVHGDIKPGNVMLTKAGIKLLDFGLAQRTGVPLPTDWANAVTQTVPQVAPGIAGTLQYLSPEQLEGRLPDSRSDIFSCGAVLYEMLTGRRAFDGDSQAGVIAAILQREVPAVSSVAHEVPAAVDHIVATCLAKDPDERWQHAGDLHRELRWVATNGGSARGATPSASVAQRAWPVIAGILTLLSLSLLGLLWLRTPSVGPPYRSSILLPDGLRFAAPGTVGGGGRLALSPDGRTLAVVVADSAGVQMLWLRPLGGTSVVRLAGTEGATAPFWSPDSRTIAFVAQAQLKRINVSGGEPVLLAAPAFGASGAWSTNDEILFTPTAGSPLFAVSASGGTARAVTSLATTGDRVHRNPTFLPGGRQFLFVAAGGGTGANSTRRAIYATSLDAADEPRLILDDASGARLSAGHLLFLRDTTLLAQAFDARTLELGGEPWVVAEQIETGGALAASFSVSETGVLAYHASTQAGSQLLWIDRQGRQLGSVGDGADYGDVELSPDGRQAAVSVSDPATNTRDLWLVDVNRGVRTRFTFDQADDVAPVWSQDGTQIIFTSNRRGHFDLYRKAASGVGVETLVYADTFDKYPTSWLSSTGLLLYWTFSADGTQMRLLRLDDGQPTTFLPSPVSPGRFAPDGRHVLYYSPESGRSEVYLVPFPDPTQRWQISSSGGNFARWRQDGKELFYISRDNKLVATSIDIRSDGVEIGQPTPLFDARPIGTRYPFDVAPDGNRFLINSVRGASAVTSVTLVQNWVRLLEP